mmetsp:Transcript_556/g.1513  ORF Transcript_556/g.1513 Transcript_556/m.1513 type:complete len:224 (+) Transcript_556:828-1499(+)
MREGRHSEHNSISLGRDTRVVSDVVRFGHYRLASVQRQFVVVFAQRCLPLGRLVCVERHGNGLVAVGEHGRGHLSCVASSANKHAEWVLLLALHWRRHSSRSLWWGLGQRSLVNLCSLKESVQGADASRLRGPRLCDVRATHLAVHKDAHANAALGPLQDLVCHGRGHAQDLREALVEAHARGHVLRKVPVLQVGHKLATVSVLHRVRQALVARVRVHAHPQR